MAWITCDHERLADIRFQDGALPHVIGACNYQVTRASRNAEYGSEHRGFTYNHAPMLAWWRSQFWYEYLSGPRGEHETPSVVWLCRSRDGIHWSEPEELFGSFDVDIRAYRGPGKEELIKERLTAPNRAPIVYHHRMGFFTSSDDRLLVTSFCGICPNPHIPPNNGYGVGRLVREIYEDGTGSDIFFLSYNAPGGFDRKNVDSFPFYEEAADAGFVRACKELLSDRVVTQQWWEEERLKQDFFVCTGGKALSYYTLPDGRIMGVFKEALTTITEDGGKTWSVPQKSPTLITSTGKVWGQQLSDGQYALEYNPSPDGAHRWPLALTTGNDGLHFKEIGAIAPEIAPCRYEGELKNLGAQYVRGVTEANHQPEDGALWTVYSVNKEDMWIARVPVPVRMEWNGPVNDDMDKMQEEQLRNTWNLYVPAWGGAELKFKDGRQSFYMWEQDPYNRVRAERNFEASVLVGITLTFGVEEIGMDCAAVLLQSGDGQTLVTVVFLQDGNVAVHTGGRDDLLGKYEAGIPMELFLQTDTQQCRYEMRLTQNGRCLGKNGAVGGAVRSVQRLLVTTKYSLPFQTLEDNGKGGSLRDLPGADEPGKRTSLWIDKLIVQNVRS